MSAEFGGSRENDKSSTSASVEPGNADVPEGEAGGLFAKPGWIRWHDGAFFTHMGEHMKRIIAAIALIVASALAPAFGQGYVAGYIGQSDYDVDCSGTTSCDTKDTAFKLAGGFMFSPNFGVEFAYTDFGKAQATAGSLGAELQATSYGLFAVAVAPIDQFTLFGKLGYARTNAKVTGSLGTLQRSQDDNRNDIAWAIGAGYYFTKNLAVELEYSAAKGEFSGETTDVYMLGLGLKFRF